MALPAPEPGLVISYSYLWHREHKLRRSEGVKTRPCVVVVAVTYEGGETFVTVAPITRQSPTKDQPAIELPLRVKDHLGLDATRSWVVLNEVNRFAWPGFDLRPASRKAGQFAYGILPPNLFRQIAVGIKAVWLRGHGKTVSRDTRRTK